MLRNMGAGGDFMAGHNMPASIRIHQWPRREHEEDDDEEQVDG